MHTHHAQRSCLHVGKQLRSGFLYSSISWKPPSGLASQSCVVSTGDCTFAFEMPHSISTGPCLDMGSPPPAAWLLADWGRLAAAAGLVVGLAAAGLTAVAGAIAVATFGAAAAASLVVGR